MKKTLTIFVFAVLSVTFLKSQNNIGIFIGGGFSVPVVEYVNTVDPKNGTPPDSLGIKSGYSFDIATRNYHVGFNFENVLVEKMLYLQFGLQAMSKGYKYSDSVYVLAHGIHIPFDIKYKYFFNKRGENFLSVNLGTYASAYYSGIGYDERVIDEMIANNDYTGLMEYDTKIKFGKIFVDEQAEMATFDYGLNFGVGIGLFGHLQINYNLGLGLPYYKVDAFGYTTNPVSGEHNYYYRNTFHTLTTAFYFTNK